MAVISQKHFQTHFCDTKYRYFDLNLIEVYY